MNIILIIIILILIILFGFIIINKLILPYQQKTSTQQITGNQQTTGDQPQTSDGQQITGDQPQITGDQPQIIGDQPQTSDGQQIIGDQPQTTRPPLSDEDILRICHEGNVPPCKKGYIGSDVKDPLNLENIARCCLIDPDRNDPTQKELALSIITPLGQGIAAGVGMYFAVKVTDYIIKNGFTKFKQLLIDKITTTLQKIGEKVGIKTAETTGTKVGGKLAVEAGEKLAVEAGEKLAVEAGEKLAVEAGEKVAEKATIKIAAAASQKIATAVSVKVSVSVASKVGARMATMAATAMAKVALGPVGWAMLAFDLFTIGLDLADPGGYSDVLYLDNFIKMRDKTNDYYNNNLIKNGIEPPLVISPISKFPDSLPEDENPDPTASFTDDMPKSKTQLYKYVYNEYISSYISYSLDIITESVVLTEPELSDVIDTLCDQALTFLDTPEGTLYIDKRICEIINGVFDGVVCGYKDKESCDTSYDWSKIRESLRTGIETTEMYVEWKDNKCISVNPTLRSSCDDQDLPYNYDKQLCVLSEEYCRSNGMKPNKTKEGIECVLTTGQTIAEFIFGTTITRGMIQVFDPMQYEPCKPGEWDGNKIPSELKTAITVCAVMGAPLCILYATLGNKLCVKDTGCVDGKHLEAGLCYDDCKEGYKSDGATLCYKQYPGYEDYLPTVTSITKRMKTNTGTIPDVCPATDSGDTGWSNRGALCIKQPVKNIEYQEKYGIKRISYPGRSGEWAADEDYETRPGDIVNYWLKADKISYVPKTTPLISQNSVCEKWDQVLAADVPPNCGNGCKNRTPQSCTKTCSAKCCGPWYNVCKKKGCKDCGDSEICAGGECTLCNPRYVKGACAIDGYSCPPETTPSGVKGSSATCLKCREGYELKALTCYEKCRDGYDHVAGVCWNKKPLSLLIPEIAKRKPVCPSDTTNIAGLCYDDDKCSGTYSMKSLGICSQDCPPKSTDFGVGCTRDSYSRGVGTTPFSMYLKKRRVPYGTKDGPSPAEAIYGLAESGVVEGVDKLGESLQTNSSETTPTTAPTTAPTSTSI